MRRLVIPVHLVVSVHDVSPATAAQTRSWCADLDARGIRAALLVIPGPWRSPALGADPVFAGWLRERHGRGDELVQHGWLHRPPATVHSGQWGRRAVAAVLARGAAEFAVLSEAQAAARLLAGQAQLAAAGIDAPGFTPPGWLASPGTTRALIRLGYRYTTSHAGVRDLRNGRWHPALALSHRPDGLGERAGAWLMGALARRAVRRGADVRIALHPADLARPGLRDAALRAIDGCLELGANPGTYLDLLGVRGGCAMSAGSAVAAVASYREASAGITIVRLANFVSPTSGGLRTYLAEVGKRYLRGGNRCALVIPGPADRDELTAAGRQLTLRAPPPARWRRIPPAGKPIAGARRAGGPAAGRAGAERQARAELGRAMGGGQGRRPGAAARGVPIVLVSHERLDAVLAPRLPRWFPLQQAPDRVNRRLARLADHVVCASHFAAAEFARIDAPRLHRLPLGVDWPRSARRRTPDPAPAAAGYW